MHAAELSHHTVSVQMYILYTEAVMATSLHSVHMGRHRHVTEALSLSLDLSNASDNVVQPLYL